MNTRFSKSILVLAIVSMLGTGAALAGNGNGDGDGNGGGKRGGNANAQGDFGGGPAGRMARMSERLGLTEDQEVALLEMFHLHEQERATMRAQIMDVYGDSICDQRQAHQEDFLSILTPEQLAEHEAAMAQRDERRANRQGRGNGGFECPAEDADDS